MSAFAFISVGLWALVASGPEAVFLSAAEAQALIENERATVIDARGRDAEAPYLPGAMVVDWMDLRSDWGRTGTLMTDTNALARAFEKRGVHDGAPVLVVGDADRGWGEEGRIWWTLRYLGHPRVYILDGGVRAWSAARFPTVGRRGQPRVRGKFTVRIVSHLRQTARQVRDRPRGVIVLDTRTAKEYRGATPYWSSRGGHVPGAKNLHWKSLLGADGTLLPRAVIERRLAQLGIDRSTPVVTYCTGGVRSAFTLAVLVHLGYRQVANYDGSWWDWSSQSALPVEKSKPHRAPHP